MNAANQTVISTGNDAELLWLRNAVLRYAGFNVLTSEGETQALKLIEQEVAGILLLGHTLSADERKHLADAFRTHSPTGRILCIENKQAAGTPDFADSIVYGLEGPEALINAIRNIGDERTDGLTP
jgi:hypothetical protein